MAYATEQLLSACTLCENLDGFVSPGQIDERIRQMVGKYKGGGGAKNVAIQKDRGVTETHLNPNFIDKGDCPKIDSEKWAIDYSHKRNRPALHKGIDIAKIRTIGRDSFIVICSEYLRATKRIPDILA